MNGALQLTIFSAVGLLVIVAVLSRRISRQPRTLLVAAETAGALPFFLRTWWRSGLAVWGEAKAEDGKMMQLFVGLAGVFISASIAIIYVGHLWVQGWQLWTWVICTIVMVAILVPFGSRPSIQLPHWKWLALLAISALLLRALFLDTVPGLLHVDEIGSADFPVRHVFPDGAATINPFVTGNSSQPVLYQYLMRLSIALAGYSIAGIRITSALAGTLAVLATYAVVAIFHDRRTALATAAIMTSYHYHVHWSRIALNNIWDTLWVPLMLAFFAWGWRKQWSGGAALAGLAAGLSQYFYAGSKLGLLLLLFVVVRLYRQDPDRQRLLIHAGKFLLMAVAVAAPITVFAMHDPETYFLRTRDVLGWREQVIVSTIGEFDLWRYFWHQVWHSFGAFTSVSEITGFYGPGVPFLIGLSPPIFVIGFLWSAWKGHVVPVLWILLTALIAGFMLGGAPSSSHYAVSIPAICWLTAAPLSFLWERGRWKLALVVLLAIMVTDALFYFAVYVPTPPRDLIFPLPPLPG
jgi:hypothetical protein